MKKLLLATVALVALGATVPALAADLAARPYTKAPAYAAPIYNWTGFYVGVNAGGAWNQSDATTTTIFSGPVLRKAIPSARVSKIGNPKTQKTASP